MFFFTNIVKNFQCFFFIKRIIIKMKQLSYKIIEDQISMNIFFLFSVFKLFKHSIRIQQKVFALKTGFNNCL